MHARWSVAFGFTLLLGGCGAGSNDLGSPAPLGSGGQSAVEITGAGGGAAARPDRKDDPPNVTVSTGQGGITPTDGPSAPKPTTDAGSRAEAGSQIIDGASSPDARPAFMGMRTMEPLIPGEQPLRFGAGQDGKSQFAGDIDRIRLYRRVLTEAEIAAQAKRTYEPCNKTSDCIGDWNFDDGTFANSAGPALPARLVGAGELIEGPEGKAVQLQGGFIEVANDPALSITDKMSWSMWLRSSVTCPDAIAAKCAAARLMDKGAWFSIESRLDHRELAIFMRDPKAKYAFGAVEGGPVPAAWTHYALTFDTAGGIRCYRNGRLVKWHSPDGRTFQPLGAGTGPLNFGADSKGAWPFPGALDNIRLYARALTAAEVASHQQRKYEPCAKASSCLGEWIFEGAMGTTIANTAGPELPAQLSGAATLTDGPDGKAVQLNGGFVTVAPTPALAASTAFSFSTWALRAPCPATFPMMCDLQRMVDRSGWFGWEQRHGGTRILLAGKAYYCDPWPKENAWAHFAITFDVKDGLRCYIDGKERRAWLAGDIDNN